jgi:hypothetical protein
LQKDLTISSGGNFQNINFNQVDLSNPAEQNISGSLILPSASYSIQSKNIYLCMKNASILLHNNLGTSGNFSYKVPVIENTTFGIYSIAWNTSYITMFFKKGITT